MEVKSFKMITGEEVVARLISTNSTLGLTPQVISYKMESPLVLSVHQQGGRVGLGFMPWTLSNPDLGEVDVPASAVVITFKPSDVIEKQYMQETSKIALP